MFDAHANFGYSTIITAPVPALTGNSLVVAAGQGALFPAVPFNCTVWPAGVTPLAANAEIVRVTSVVGDTLTITRAQEGTAAIAIAVGHQIANTTSVKVFTDIEAAIPVQFVSNISAAGGSNSGAIVFSNSNNVSFGMNAGVVTASASGIGGGGGAAISAVASSQNTGTVIFSNSNGVSFGLNAGTLTAQHNGLTSQSNQAASASNGSFAFQTLGFSNANGVTFGTSAGSIVTASIAAVGGAQTGISGIEVSNTTYTSGTVTFRNANGISFGASGVNGISASYTVPAQSTQPVAASASNGSFLFSTLGFSNGNGVTFGTSAGSIISASVATGLTSQSNQVVSNSAGSFTFQTLNFSNANNVTFGTSVGGIVTASVATGLTSQSNQVASASNGSFTFQTLNFSNASNVTFATSAGGIVIASVAAQSVQPVNASAPNGSFNFSTIIFSNSNNVSWSTTAGNGIVASVTVASTQASIAFGAAGSTNTGSQIIFSNSNNVTFGLNASTITGSASFAQSNQQMTLFGTGNTTGSSSGTTNASSVIFRGSGAITVAITNGSIVFDAPSAAAGNVTFSAGVNSAGLNSIVFSDLNNVSFGLNGSTITATVASTQASIRFFGANSGGGSTNTLVSDFYFIGANNLSISMSLNSMTLNGQPPILTLFGAGNTTGSSSGTTNASSVIFRGSGAVTVAITNGSIVFDAPGAAAGGPIKYWANFPGLLNSVPQTLGVSTSQVMPLYLQAPVSFDFIRLIGSGANISASTTAATTGNTQFSCGYTKSHNFVFYSRGSGASSGSLQSYYSTQIVENYSHNVSAATNSTQFSYSQRYSFPCSTGVSGFTVDYSSSANSMNFNSLSISLFNSFREIDFKVATTLSAGQWWMVWGHSSSTNSQFTSVGIRNVVTYNQIAVSQAAIQLARIGSATNSTLMPQWGAGSFTTAGGGTTGSLNFSNISSNASNVNCYFRLMVTT